VVLLRDIEDLTPQMRDVFTDLYRRWRSEHQ